MFIKIFCGDSDKYLLLQSTNVTLNKRKTRIWHELFPIVCSYIEQLSLPTGDCDMGTVKYLEEEFKKRSEYLGSQDDKFFFQYKDIRAFIADLCPCTPDELIVPILSDDENGMKILSDLKECPNKEQSEEVVDVTYLAEIAVIEVDEKTYITTGPIFVMNDEGKTIDRV